MTTIINSFDDFKNWLGSGSAELGSDITINDTSYSNSAPPFTLGVGYTFDGKGYTIFVNTGTGFNGVIKLAGGTIQHLNLVITSATLANACGWVAYGINSSTITGAYGTIYNVSVNASLVSAQTNAGGISGARSACKSNGSSFVLADSTYNLTIANCKYVGAFGQGGGCILGKYSSNINNLNDGASGGGVISIENCYVQITGSGSNGGGIFGSFCAKNYTGSNNIIKRCIIN